MTKGKMKTLLLMFLLLAVGIIYYQPKVATAQQDPTVQASPSGIKAKAPNALEQRRIKQEEKVANIRNSGQNRINHFNKVIEKETQLLDKLQTRIDKAKAAGQDVTKLNSLMADAKLKLGNAKTKVATVESSLTTATTRANFKAVYASFRLIKEDLHAIRKAAASMIKILKGFNSATSEGKNPQKEGTTPGTGAN